MGRLLLAAGLFALGLAASVRGNALDDYCNRPDPVFKWEVIPNTETKLFGATGYMLNMTSLTWLTKKDSSSPVWWHYMMVIIPDNVVHKDAAMLWITGGENSQSLPKWDGEDADVSLALARNTKTTVVALFQIPNEPIWFPSDPIHKRRVEDAIIAFTWQHFLDNPTDPNWLLRFPMTKAAVAAMNATEQYLAQHHGQTITRWLAAGASKRGWTTWTLGAVEAIRPVKRLQAIVPIVMDALNLEKNLHHMYRNLGGWTFAFKDYYALNLTARFDDPNFPAMAALIDPYSYLPRYKNMPKLVVDATDDEFFQPDDNYYWWDKMEGEKHLMMCQNAEHSLATAIPEVLMGVSAFASAILDKTARPEFTWDMDFTNNTLTVKEVKGQAVKAKLRYAWDLSHKRKDFRWIVKEPKDGCTAPLVSLKKKSGICLQPIIWLEEDLKPVAPGEWKVTKPIPKKGWHGMFIELYYKSPSAYEYRLTTQMLITPNTFPFPNCHGEGCRGTLV